VAGTIKIAQNKTILSSYQSLEYLSQGFQRICQSFINAIVVAPGPLTAYRKEALVKAGYFDDDTLVEDFDMTIKIQKSGYKVISEKKAEALTVAPDTLEKWKKQRIRWSRGSIQIFKKHFDVFSNENTRSLAMFSFPMLILWMGLPYVMLTSYILIGLQNIMAAIEHFNPNILFSLPFLLQQKSIYELYIGLEKYLIVFLSLDHLTNTIVMGYISLFIFLIYTVLSFKALREKFEPKDLKGLALISIYWYMLVLVFIYAAFLEFFKKRGSW
jgi:cellulose synthase/poly-beta-1,6-N-acetylglucosamine synthase-like glycosyltransferase